MSKPVYFDKIALRQGTQVYTTKFTHADSLAESQGWTMWVEPGDLWIRVQWKNGPVNLLPPTSVGSAVCKREVVEEPKPLLELPDLGDLQPAEDPKVVIETPKEILAAKPEVAKPAAKSKLPPRRGSAPVAEGDA